MRIVVSTIALLACTSLANAADLGGPYEPYGGSLKDAPYAAAAPFSWTGFYIGANVGHGWGKLDAGHGVEVKPEGWFGGGQVGYNFQSGQLVFGVEADIQGTGMDDSIAGSINQFDARASVDINHFGSVRGRLGLALDRVMPYVTGGFAWADVDTKLSVEGLGSDKDSAIHTGWVIGGGLEFALARNWSAKAEYLYFDLGEEKYTFGAANQSESAKADLAFHTLRVGLNYRF